VKYAKYASWQPTAQLFWCLGPVWTHRDMAAGENKTKSHSEKNKDFHE